MRLSSALTGCLLAGLAAGTSAELQGRDACVQDALYNCFTSSLAAATQYCTNSVVTVPTVTSTVTVTPTVTFTEAVTETATETAVRIAKRNRRKRAACAPKPALACLRNVGPIEPAQFTSACSCIGITTATDVATATADSPVTVTETRTTTATVVITPTSTLEPESTSTSTVSTSNAAPAPTTPVIINGDFGTGTLEGWSIASQMGGGATASVVEYGSGHVLQILTSYFTSNAVTSMSVAQDINCVPGTLYTLSAMVSVVSSYSNGSPWSVQVGSTVLASGAGSSLAWMRYSWSFQCSEAASANRLTFKLQSNNNRAARLLVTNVSVVVKAS